MAEDATPVLENACRSSMTTSIAPILSPADIAIVPNPANDRAFIHLPETASPLTSLDLTDVAGRSFQVPVSLLHDQWYAADLSKLAQGIYLIRIATPTQQGVARLVRQ